ncbi:MAG: helix-turn-helix transcriptional regulator [bacterium]|nr:helix-turn-helix transcriptional regulator [bacterium]
MASDTPAASAPTNRERRCHRARARPEATIFVLRPTIPGIGRKTVSIAVNSERFQKSFRSFHGPLQDSPRRIWDNCTSCDHLIRQDNRPNAWSLRQRLQGLPMGKFEASPPDLPGIPADSQAGGEPVPVASGEYAPLIDACFAEFREAVESGETTWTEPLITALEEMALIEQGALKPASRRAQQALRIGRLSLARRLIGIHLTKPSLSPAMVAGLLGVSLRHMHMLFEGTGRSFSQTVTAQRIRLSGRLLRERPRLPVAGIAHASGFDSLATFYRIFHATLGMTPGEFRAHRAQTAAAAPLPPGPRAPAPLTAK